MTGIRDVAVDHLAAVVAAKAGGQPRDGQIVMCEAVADALADRVPLVVEAPTGTGKSFAYLAPAVAAVVARRGGEEHRPLVVCTATKALQEQLVDEDLPAVAAALASRGVRFSYSLLKGRSNYLCQARFEEVTASAAGRLLFDVGSSSEAVAAAADLARIEAWAATTDAGDRAELSPGVCDAAWAQVSISSGECPGRAKCVHADVCFAEKARAAARAADVTVVNAALYAADLVSGGRVLGEHDAVVIDEAHTFDDVVTDAFTVRLSAARLGRVAGLARAAGANQESVESVVRGAEALGVLLSSMASIDGGDGQRVDLDGDLAASVAELDAAVAVVGASLAAVAAGSQKLDQAVAAVADLARDLAQLGRDDLADHHVAWVEVFKDRASLVCAPVSVAGLLGPALWAQRTVIATSATLQVGGRFDDFARRSGLESAGVRWRSLEVPSPFDYRRQAVLFVAKDLPDPRAERFEADAAVVLERLIRAAGGRTLALFTSRRAVTAMAARLAGPLAAAGITVACQGDAPRGVLVDRLRSSASAGGFVVFATQSFWTGVDVQGAGVSLVVIDKLPFARPTDPIAVERRRRVEAAGLDPFRLIDVPRAATLLAQGAGRLIRARDDRGVVAVLDRRLAVAGYRSTLLDSLPPFTRSVDVERVCGFLAGLAQEAAGLSAA